MIEKELITQKRLNFLLGGLITFFVISLVQSYGGNDPSIFGHSGLEIDVITSDGVVPLATAITKLQLDISDLNTSYDTFNDSYNSSGVNSTFDCYSVRDDFKRGPFDDARNVTLDCAPDYLAVGGSCRVIPFDASINKSERYSEGWMCDSDSGNAFDISVICCRIVCAP